MGYTERTPLHPRFNARSLFCLMAAIALIAGPAVSGAAVHTARLGSTIPATFDQTPMTATTAEQFIGGGSWHFLKTVANSSKCNIYLSTDVAFGVAVKMDDIASITFSTYNVANPSPIEFYLNIYTKGTAHGWYDQRLTAEPYLKNAPAYSPVLGSWVTWTTDSPGELTFNDSNNSGNFGFYGAPTLADIQAGAINWSTWGANPTSGSASATPYDYGPKEVLAFSIQTGSGNPSFDSYIDAVTITMMNGEVYVFDLEVDDIVTPGPAATCITPTNPCISIPFDIARATTADMRGYSVTFKLSPELILCSGIASVTEGSYLSSIGGTHFQVLDNGGGSYTVDCAILGLPCGATAASGNLFNIDVKKSGADGTGTVKADTLIARDCINQPIPGDGGAPLSITIDSVAPTAITNLAASQVKLGNDSDGTTKITLTFTAPGDAAVTEVYRAGFGDYPEYDDGTGAVPATPSYPPGPPWALTGVTATGQMDETTARDFWYFVAFTKDSCGNVSAVSNKTGGTLNYHLGDTHNGSTNCVGDNLVGTPDISHLGANYGVTGLPYGDPRNCLDVGPTTDNFVNARPTTDNKIQFEDLLMFAINHGTVSKPSARIVERGPDALSVRVPEIPAPGREFDVVLDLAAGNNIQGLSLDLGFDGTVVEPVAVISGELMDRQGAQAVVLSTGAANVDAAILGPGATLSGEGEMARVTFRVIAAGDPAIGIARIEARDPSNRPIEIGTTGADAGVKPPARTFLGAGYPNPFSAATRIPMSLRAGGNVRLDVFDVAGRHVRSLVRGFREAGNFEIEWDGRDDAGRNVPSGMYGIRLTTPDARDTRTVQIVR